MSADIINLRPRETAQYLWACDCGSTTHHAHADGKLVCASCEAVGMGENGLWRERLPALPDAPPPLDAANFKVTNLADAPSFLRRQLKGGEEMAGVVVVFSDGSLALWTSQINTPERHEWFAAKLADALARIPKS